MRIKIVEIGSHDAYVDDAHLICGQSGEMDAPHASSFKEVDGFVGGWVTFDHPEFIKGIENSGAINEDTMYFCQIKIQELS